MQGEVWAIIVVEILPSCKLCIEINIIGIGQKLIKLGLVGSMGSFNFPVELRGSRLDVDMLDAQVFHMPVEPSLKLVPPVGSDCVDAKRKFLEHIIHELDGTVLVVFREDLYGSNTRRVIDGGILVSPHRLSRFIFQVQELDIDLNVVSGNRLGIALAVNCSSGGGLG